MASVSTLLMMIIHSEIENMQRDQNVISADLQLLIQGLEAQRGTTIFHPIP